MTHIEKVKKLAAEKKITVLDLNELLRLEVDRHLSDVEFYDSGTANVYIPITFDVDSAFGLDVVCDTTKSRKPDYINLYINYSKNGDMELFIDYCNNSTGDGDIDVAVELTPEQYKAVKKRFEKQFEDCFGISIANAIKQECKLEG